CARDSSVRACGTIQPMSCSPPGPVTRPSREREMFPITVRSMFASWIASLVTSGRERKCRLSMAFMRNVHHGAGPRRAAMGQTGTMDGPQNVPAPNVLALPQAPDAIELRHLRAFVAVADDLSFSRAAQRLFISQPALSRQIRGLERLLGCDLFRRSTQRVELTLAGEALLARARTLLADLDDAISVTRSVGGELAGRMALLWEPWARAS